jgi:predicted dehydrogenase
MNDPLDIGVIGCGRVTERCHLPALARLAAMARVVAVADPLPARAEMAATLFPGCRTFSSVQDLLRDTRLTAILVATPPQTHVSIATRALRAGIAVLVEKPLAASLAEVKELQDLDPLSTAQVMVGFNQRYWEPVQRLEEALQGREAAEEFSADLVMKTSPRAWSSVSPCSDALEDLAPHLLDLLRYLFQLEILAVGAVPVGEGGVDLTIGLSGGHRAKCLVAHGGVTEESIRVRCKDVHYQVSMGSERIGPANSWRRSALDFLESAGRTLLRRRSSLHDSYERQLQQFFRSVRAGTRLTPSVADGIAVVPAIEAARRSLNSGGKEVLV